MSLSPLLDAAPAVQLHATAALSALLLGALVLFSRKGTPPHRTLGRVWAGLMLVTAGSALFINEIRLIGPFSPIHLFSIVTFAGIAEGIRQIRRGDVRRHRAMMQGLYFFALILTGAFTLLPGRRMHAVLFGTEAGWAPALAAIALALGASLLIWRRLLRAA